MTVVLWVLASLLGVVFLATGLSKIVQPKEKLAAAGMTRWAEDFSPPAVKTLGALQVAAALGLILPAIVNIAPVLVPLAATGLAAMMIGAAIVHVRRKETQPIIANAVLIVLSAVVAWGRFGPYAF
jgi:uncharacterized membrane protein YphA (DoxX/SURF4 family)